MFVALTVACGARAPAPTSTISIVERGSRLSFPPIEFEPGSVVLSPDARALLDEVRTQLLARPRAELVIENRDETAASAEILNRRVKAIELYLREGRSSER